MRESSDDSSLLAKQANGLLPRRKLLLSGPTILTDWNYNFAKKHFTFDFPLRRLLT